MRIIIMKNELVRVVSDLCQGLGSAADKGYAEHSVQATLTSHQYKSYKVSMLQKLKNTEVQLGISGEQIEVDPLQTPRPFWSTKPKAVRKKKKEKEGRWGEF